MGKKSRRSNRRDRSTESGSNIPLILRRLLEVEKDACESHKNRFYSKAAQNYQEGLQIIKQNITPKNTASIDSHFQLFETEASCSLNLMIVEYSRCRFDKVIQIYHDIQMSAENKKVLLSFMCKLQGQLAMLKLDGSKENKEKVVSLINTRVSKGMTDPTEIVKSLEAVMILRNMKEYDSAIDLGEKLERLREIRDLSTFENSRKIVIGDVGDIAAFENVLSHLERYRAGYHGKKGKVFHKDSLNRLLEAFYKMRIRGGLTPALSQRCDAYAIMLAQRRFLCHQALDKEESTAIRDSAIKNVERYLETIWQLDRHCFTCHQKGTATEVQLVCSGCRVACYCSLDHQRLTWKKDAIKGMRIGHEILCPLWKAYRKWKLVSKKGNEKELKVRRRFDRECLYFLSHGLGLKDKCFQYRDVQKFVGLGLKDKCFEEKDMQKFLSLQNTCK